MKIVSIVLAGLFLLNSTVYGIDLSNISHLRVPFTSKTKDGQGRLEEGMAAMLNKAGLSSYYHGLLNRALGTFFVDVDEVGEDIDVLDNEKVHKVDPYYDLGRIEGLRVYRFNEKQLRKALKSIGASRDDIEYIVGNLISHPGVFRDEKGRPRATNLFILDTHYNLLSQLNVKLKAQWARHEKAHLENLVLPKEERVSEKQIKDKYPLDDVVEVLRRLSEDRGALAFELNWLRLCSVVPLEKPEPNDKIIFLDLGNVVFRVEFDKVAVQYAVLFKAPKDIVLSFLTNFEPDSPMTRFENGLLTKGKFYFEFLRYLNAPKVGSIQDLFRRLNKERFFRIWDLIVGDEIEGVREFLEEKHREGYKIYTTSNTSPSHVLLMQDKFPWLFNITHGMFPSALVGESKPGRDFFAVIKSELGIRPSNTVIFIDDSARNVERAQRSGIQAIQFEHHRADRLDRLRTEFAKLEPKSPLTIEEREWFHLQGIDLIFVEIVRRAVSLALMNEEQRILLRFNGLFDEESFNIREDYIALTARLWQFLTDKGRQNMLELETVRLDSDGAIQVVFRHIEIPPISPGFKRVVDTSISQADGMDIEVIRFNYYLGVVDGPSLYSGDLRVREDDEALANRAWDTVQKWAIRTGVTYSRVELEVREEVFCVNVIFIIREVEAALAQASRQERLPDGEAASIVEFHRWVMRSADVPLLGVLMDDIETALREARIVGYECYGNLEVPKVRSHLYEALNNSITNAYQHNNDRDPTLPIYGRAFYNDGNIIIQIVGGGYVRLDVSDDEVFLVKDDVPIQSISSGRHFGGVGLKNTFNALNFLIGTLVRLEQDITMRWYHLSEDQRSLFTEYADHSNTPVVTEICIPLQSATKASAQASGGGRTQTSDTYWPGVTLLDVVKDPGVADFSREEQLEILDRAIASLEQYQRDAAQGLWPGETLEQREGYDAGAAEALAEAERLKRELLEKVAPPEASGGEGSRDADKAKFEGLLAETLDALDRAEGLLEALPNFEVLDTVVHDLIGNINGMVWSLEALGESEVVRLYRQRYRRLRRELNRQIAIARINTRRTTFEESQAIPAIFDGKGLIDVREALSEVISDIAELQFLLDTVGDGYLGHPLYDKYAIKSKSGMQETLKKLKERRRTLQQQGDKAEADLKTAVDYFCDVRRLSERLVNEIPVVIVSIPARYRERIKKLKELFGNRAVVINTHDIVYTDTARYFENFFDKEKGYPDGEVFRDNTLLDLESLREHLDNA